MSRVNISFKFHSQIHRDARDQKFMMNEGNAVNQLINAMAVAVSNCTQWFLLQLSRSLSIRTVMPAEAHAAANVRVDVIPSPIVNKLTILQFCKDLFTSRAYMSMKANKRLHILCKPAAATR